MKHLQLNTSILRSPDEVIQLILDEEIDIACLNEVAYEIGKEHPLKSKLESKGYYYAEGIHFIHKDTNRNLGVAIVSKFPIIDYTCHYYNSENYQPKIISDDDSFLGKLIDDDNTTNPIGSRGLKHYVKSRCMINTLVEYESKKFARVISTQFTVSDLCTETKQMFDMSNIIKSLVQNSKDIPLIFAGDLNIRADSYSIKNLESVMTCHSKDLKDTLSESHKAKIKDFPDGLAVDHVFSKGLEWKSISTKEISFSDHKAVTNLFEFKDS